MTNTKELSNILIENDSELERVIKKALKLQIRDNAKKDYSEAIQELKNLEINNYSTKEIYKVGDELGIPQDYMKKVIQGFDIHEDIPFLYKEMGFKKFVDHNLMKQKVHEFFIKTLQKAKRFKDKIYTLDEIKKIFQEKNIFLKIDEEMTKKCIEMDHKEYKLVQVSDGETKKYGLYKKAPRFLR